MQTGPPIKGLNKMLICGKFIRQIKKNLAPKFFLAGFSLIEIIVSVAIFAILATSAYGLYATIVKAITYYRGQTTISALANQYLEVARNLSYSQIGTLSGNPNGPLPDSPAPLAVNFNGVDYQIYYVVNALHDPADINIGVQDYKQVKLYVKNVFTGVTNSFVTTIAPISLASLGSGGVLSVQAINKEWLPVSGATAHITNTSITPNINLTRTSGVNGKWIEIGLPPDSNYHITVTKSGYSVDQTYSVAQYPNASNPDAAVIDGEVTQTTFLIDRLSSLSFTVLNQTCQPIPSVGVNVRGSKLIGPGATKFNENYTSDGSGEIYPASATSCSSSCGAASCCLEWDVYTPALTGLQYMIYGTSPVQSVDLSPNTKQNFNLILGPETDNSLLVVAKDVSGNPIEGAKIELSNIGIGYDDTKYTGGSAWNQNDWSGGSGQINWVFTSQYYQDDGGISNNAIPLALRLAPGSSPYGLYGSLISSSFDTGTNQTSYTTLNWKATVEDQVTSVKFQIATNNDNETWNFTGPDGTDGSYYEVSGTTINSINNNKRYVRYKVFLSTTDQQKTPMLSNITVNYVSGCSTPGQVIFTGLTADANYAIIINDDPEQTFNNIDIIGYFIFQAVL